MIESFLGITEESSDILKYLGASQRWFFVNNCGNLFCNMRAYILALQIDN